MVVVAGAAVTMEAWRHEVPAVLLGWYSGMEGGAALADVLLGDREPGGRLPFASRRDEADLPPFDKNATAVTYDRWHGQRLLDRTGTAAAYPLGFGLSYTLVRAGDVAVGRGRRRRADGPGDRGQHRLPAGWARRAGVRDPARPEGVDRFLVGFARVEVAPGERVPVAIEVPLRPAGGPRGRRDWQLPAGPYRHRRRRPRRRPGRAHADRRAAVLTA